MVKIRGFLLVGLNPEQRHGVIKVRRETVDNQRLVSGVKGKLIVVHFHELRGGNKLAPRLANRLETEKRFHR